MNSSEMISQARGYREPRAASAQVKSGSLRRSNSSSPTGICNATSLVAFHFFCPIRFFLRRFSMRLGPAKSSQRAGFTLIELLVVIAIIAILIAPVASRGPGRPRSSPPYAVPQQSEAVRHRVPQLPRRLPDVPPGCLHQPATGKILRLGPNDAPELCRAGQPDPRGATGGVGYNYNLPWCGQGSTADLVISGAKASGLWRCPSDTAAPDILPALAIGAGGFPCNYDFCHGVNDVTGCGQEAGATWVPGRARSHSCH